MKFNSPQKNTTSVVLSFLSTNARIFHSCSCTFRISQFHSLRRQTNPRNFARFHDNERCKTSVQLAVYVTENARPIPFRTRNRKVCANCRQASTPEVWNRDWGGGDRRGTLRPIWYQLTRSSRAVYLAMRIWPTLFPITPFFHLETLPSGLPLSSAFSSSPSRAKRCSSR